MKAALSRTTMEREQMEAKLKEQVAEHSSKVQECLGLLEQTSLEEVTTRCQRETAKLQQTTNELNLRNNKIDELKETSLSFRLTCPPLKKK